MARGIMADKEDKVASPTSEQPTNSTKFRRNSNTLNNNNDNSDHNSTIGDSIASKPVSSSTATATTPSSTCSCTKISTMQLFYEMKQKFPTVPDNVVCEFVGQNCHNRSACIDSLEDYPNSANVYPQALRNQPIKKKTTQCATTGTTTNLSESHQLQQQQQQKPTTAKHPNTTDSEQMTTTNPPTTISNVQRKVAPPTTLNLTNLNCCTRPVNRPTRQAPPPPIVTTPTTAAAATTPTQSIKSLPNQPLNLSVNVIVSPVTRTPKSQQSHYSFTLHQPNNNNAQSTNTASHPTLATASAADVQSTADISIAAAATKTPTTTTDAQQFDIPSLTYTSSAYDAEIGYQSRFEITVAGMSAKSNDNNNNNNCDPLKNDNANDENSSGSNVSLTRSCETTAADQHHQLPSVVASAEFLEETETVHHQILCKQKLVLELEKDRKRLERMQRELQAIQAPMPDGGLDGLNQEIDKLRNDCKVMAQYVEEAGPSYALGETNEAFYRNIYTGQQLPIMQQRPLRPHRPAPVPDFNQTQNRVINHINLAGTDPRFASSATTAAAGATGVGASSIPQPTLNRPFNESNEDGWVCDLCTFQNKYTQRTCEACTMPFLSAGNQMGCYNNSGLFAPMPIPAQSPSSLPLSLASPLLSPSQSMQHQQQQQPYSLSHYMPMQMPMPMPMPMPYSLHNNNNNNIPHVHSSYYRPPQQPKFYVYDTSRY